MKTARAGTLMGAIGLLGAVHCGGAPRSAPPPRAPLSVSITADSTAVLLARGGASSTFLARREETDYGVGVTMARVVPLRVDGSADVAFVRWASQTAESRDETTVLLDVAERAGEAPRRLWSMETVTGGMGMESLESFVWLVDLDGDGVFEILWLTTHYPDLVDGLEMTPHVFRAGPNGRFVLDEALTRRAPTASPSPRPTEADLAFLRARYGAPLLTAHERFVGALDRYAVYGSLTELTLLRGAPGGAIETFDVVLDGLIDPPRVVSSRSLGVRPAPTD